MAGKADIKAGSAFVELFLKSGPLVRGLRQVQGQLTALGSGVARFGGGISALGASIVGPLAASVRHFTEAGGRIDDMANRTGLARTELAKLDYAAGQTGATLEDVEKAIVNQRKKGVAGTFDEVAARIAAIQDPAERTKAAFEAWGKSGTKLIPLAMQLKALKAEAGEIGIGASEEDIKLADELGDMFTKITAQLSATVFSVGAALAPMLLEAATAVSGIVKGITKWVNENRALVRTIAIIGAGLLAIGTVITAIGGGLIFAGLALGAIATILPILGTALAFAVSPVGLILIGVTAIGVALAAAVVWWAKFTKSGKAAFSALSAALKPFADTLKTAFDGVVDALRAGNLELAWKVVVTSMQLLWFQFIESIVGKFFDFIQLVADNPLVRDLIGESLGGKIDAMIKAGRGGNAAAVAGLAKELEELRRKAAAGVPPKGAKAADGLAEGDEAEKAGNTGLRTAATTGAAIALQFGQRFGGDLTKEQLEELRFIRRISIKQHGELLEQFKRFNMRFAP